MKTNLSEQVNKEYREYLRTKAMVDYYKPLMKAFAREHSSLKDWTVTFGNDQRVLVMFYSTNDSQSNLSDFLKIRDSLVASLGREDQPVVFKTKLENHLGAGAEYIGARASLPSVNWRHGRFNPTIEIRMFNIDKCEIEYVEKIVKEPVLTGFCAEVIQ